MSLRSEPGEAMETSEEPRQSPGSPVSNLEISPVDLIHEIRNPLNGMDTILQLMERHLVKLQAQEDSVLVSYVQGMKKEIYRLRTLLLDIRTLWSGDLKPASVSISSLIDEVSKDVANYGGGNIQVENNVPESLPPVFANGKLLKRALCNLMKNAVEAIPNGGKLTFQARSGEGSVDIEVVDTGIKSAQGEKIFHPFASSKPEEMGPGRSIVKRIMSALGAKISYSSQPGQGTTFRLSLPLLRRDTR